MTSATMESPSPADLKRSIVTALREAVHSESRGDRDSAIRAYSTALRWDPDHPEALNNRGALHYRSGNLKAAYEDFSRAIEHKTNYPEALHNRGVVLLDRHDLDGARCDLDRALAIKPDYTEALRHRGEVRSALGDHDGALSDFDRALQSAAPDQRAGIHHGRGGVHVHRRDFQAAVDDFDRALAADPRLWTAYLFRGNARFHLSDPGGLSDYWMAFLIRPESVAEELAVRIIRDAREYARFVQVTCERHIRMDPDDLVARARRGLTALAIGDEDAAARDFDLIQDRRPEWVGHLGPLIQQTRRLRDRPVDDHGRSQSRGCQN